MPNIILVSPYGTLTTIKICSAAARHIQLTSFNENFQQSAYKRIFCVFGGTISEDWSRFVLTTGGPKKGYFWMLMISEKVGEFLKGDWDRSRLITGGIIGGNYCSSRFVVRFLAENCVAWPLALVRLLHGWLSYLEQWRNTRASKSCACALLWVGTRKSTQRQRLAGGALNSMWAIKPNAIKKITLNDKVGHKRPR